MNVLHLQVLKQYLLKHPLSCLNLTVNLYLSMINLDLCLYDYFEGDIRPNYFKLKNSQNIPSWRKVFQNTKFNNVLENNFSNKNRIHKFSPRNKLLHNVVCFSCGKFGHKDYSCYLSKYNVFNMNANMKWIPKFVNTNFLGPKQVWVPKCQFWISLFLGLFESLQEK